MLSGGIASVPLTFMPKKGATDAKNGDDTLQGIEFIFCLASRVDTNTSYCLGTESLVDLLILSVWD
jgi:hypothetical protein